MPPTEMIFARKLCRSCGAPVIWVRTINGKAQPLDAEPQKRVIINDDGIGLVVDTYMPHHATCPYADRHRKL